MQKITPFLWFDNQAEEARNFYVSVFRNSNGLNVQRYGPEGAKASGRPQGTVMTASFLLDGQEFVALNGGPVYRFSPAIPFVVNCETQQEVDEYWQKLTPAERRSSRLAVRFGVSWQIVPTLLDKLLGDPDPVKSERTKLQMKKIDIAGLERAYNEGGLS